MRGFGHKARPMVTTELASIYPKGLFVGQFAPLMIEGNYLTTCFPSILWFIIGGIHTEPGWINTNQMSACVISPRPNTICTQYFLEPGLCKRATCTWSSIV